MIVPSRGDETHSVKVESAFASEMHAKSMMGALSGRTHRYHSAGKRAEVSAPEATLLAVDRNGYRFRVHFAVQPG